MKTECHTIARDRIFFAYAKDPKDFLYSGGEMGQYMESLGHFYRLEETRIEAEGDKFIFTALLRYKPHDRPEKCLDLNRFVLLLGLREIDPDSWSRARRIRMDFPPVVWPTDCATGSE